MTLVDWLLLLLLLFIVGYFAGCFTMAFWIWPQTIRRLEREGKIQIIGEWLE